MKHNSPFDIPNTTSPLPSKTSFYYSLESPYVIPTTDHPSPSSPCSLISSPSSVSQLSLTSQTSSESSNGQPSPISTTSIPTPLPSPPPLPPPNTRQSTITEPTSFIVANNSPEWRQAMKEEYDALVKNGTWSLVSRAFNNNVVDCINKGTIDNIICQLGSAFALKDLWPLNKGTIDNIICQFN
ncbi:nucleotide-binding alpha-beta plait domain-containing protein [Tanacetum coccineum]